MKKNLILLNLILLFFILISIGYGIFENLRSSPRAEGLANAYSALSDDPSALQYNPAGLSQLKGPSALSFYKLLYQGMGVGLHHIGFNFALPVKRFSGVIGWSFQEIGFSLHSERIFSLGYGLDLRKDLSLGVVIRGYNLAQKNYGQGYSLGIDFGVIGRIYRRWQYGFAVQNINRPQMGFDTKYLLPQRINLGLVYTPTAGINSVFEISKEVGRPTQFAVGQELQIVENYLTLRAGIATEPLEAAFGLRSGLGKLVVDYGLSWKAELPLTHSWAISYQF
jgi:hypothetical protein